MSRRPDPVPDLAHGQGSVFEDARGRIRAERRIDGKKRTFYTDADGARFADRAAAARFLIDLAARLDRGDTLDADRMTFGDYMAYWLDHVAPLDRAPGTVKRYRIAYELHLSSLDAVLLRRLTPARVQVALSALSTGENALAASTVGVVRSILTAALNHAVEQRLLDSNPAAGRRVTTPRVPEREARFLTPEQAGAFLAAIRGRPDEVAYVLAIALGLRNQEARRLEWRHVDLARCVVAVPGTKTRASRATVPLPHFLVPVLRRLRAAQARRLLELGIPLGEETPLLAIYRAEALDPSTLQRHIKEILSAAGLPTMRYHDLRHSCASLLLHFGVPMHVVQAILRHSNISTTMDVYAHLMPQATVEALGRLGRLFGAEESAE